MTGMVFSETIPGLAVEPFPVNSALPPDSQPVDWDRVAEFAAVQGVTAELNAEFWFSGTGATAAGIGYSVLPGATRPAPTGTNGFRMSGAVTEGRCTTSVLKAGLANGVTMIRPAPPAPPASVVPVESAPPPPPPGCEPAEPAVLADPPPAPPAPPPVPMETDPLKYPVLMDVVPDPNLQQAIETPPVP